MKHVLSWVAMTVAVVCLGQEINLESFNLSKKKFPNFSTSFSYDGKLLAAGGVGSVVVWDVEKRSIVKELEHNDALTYAVAFSPDGYYVAASSDEAVYVFTVTNGFLDKRFVGHQMPVISAVFSPDGQFLYTGGADNIISVWDLNKNMKISELRGHNGPVTGLAISPVGGTLASSSEDKNIIIWDLKTNSKKYNVNLKGGSVWDLSFDPKGQTLAAALQDKSVRLVDVENKSLGLLLRGGHKDGIYKVKFSRDGQYVFGAGKDEMISIWSAETGENVLKLRKEIIGSIGIDVNPQGTYLAVAEGPGSNQMKMMKLAPLKIKPAKLKPIFVHEDAGNNSYLHPTKTKLEFNDIKPTLSIIQPKLEGANKNEMLHFEKEMEVKGSVKSENGLFEFTINGQEIQTDAEGNFTHMVKLAYGHNTVRFKATDIYNNVSRESFTLVRQVKVAGYNDTLGRAGTDYALIIATDEYDSWEDLSNPVFDGETIAKELETKFGFKAEVVKNPSKTGMLSKLREYSKKVYADDDQLFVFIAGHGVFDEIFSDGYLVASDSRMDDELKETYISQSNLRTIVNNIPCNHICLTMDACFGGTFDPFTQGSRGMRGAPLLGPNKIYGASGDSRKSFIERKMTYHTRRFFTSGGKEYVPDGRPGHHSPFARKFLEALRQEGGQYGVITYLNVWSYLEQLDPHPTQGEWGRNQPGSDFLFILKKD